MVVEFNQLSFQKEKESIQDTRVSRNQQASGSVRPFCQVAVGVG